MGLDRGLRSSGWRHRLAISKEVIKMEKLNNFKVADNFNLREFQCPCCGTVKISPTLVAKLQEMRFAWGKPINISSGYRCKKHNEEVHGHPQSYHMQGVSC